MSQNNRLYNHDKFMPKEVQISMPFFTAPPEPCPGGLVVTKAPGLPSKGK